MPKQNWSWGWKVTDIVGEQYKELIVTDRVQELQIRVQEFYR